MKFSIIGSGNVAFHFSEMLVSSGHQLLQIYSRNAANAGVLANKYSAVSIVDPAELDRKNDLVIIAVNDENIPAISTRIDSSIAVVHTSGTAPIASLAQQNRGVVWPVFSLTKGIAVDYKSMPLLIESDQPEFSQWLQTTFHNIGCKVSAATGNERAKAHLAAVFANNFSNCMYAIAEEIMQNAHLDFNLLIPLITQGNEKILTHSPHDAQTGPARRNDRKTIAAHQQLLAENPEILAIYNAVTDIILETYHDKKL